MSGSTTSHTPPFFLSTETCAASDQRTCWACGCSSVTAENNPGTMPDVFPTTRNSGSSAPTSSAYASAIRYAEEREVRDRTGRSRAIAAQIASSRKPFTCRFSADVKSNGSSVSDMDARSSPNCALIVSFFPQHQTASPFVKIIRPSDSRRASLRSAQSFGILNERERQRRGSSRTGSALKRSNGLPRPLAGNGIFTEADCQRRRKNVPARRRKSVPRARWQLVPVVHGRDPRAGRCALRAAGGGPRVGGACGPTGSSGGLFGRLPAS